MELLIKELKDSWGDWAFDPGEISEGQDIYLPHFDIKLLESKVKFDLKDREVYDMVFLTGGNWYMRLVITVDIGASEDVHGEYDIVFHLDKIVQVEPRDKTIVEWIEV